jgi:hypothetical protein
MHWCIQIKKKTFGSGELTNTKQTTAQHHGHMSLFWENISIFINGNMSGNLTVVTLGKGMVPF